MSAYTKIEVSPGKTYAVPTSVWDEGDSAVDAWLAQNPQSIEDAKAASKSYKEGAPIEDRTSYMGTRSGFDAGDILQGAMPLSSYGAKRDYNPVAVGAMGAVDAATWAFPPIAAARIARAAVPAIRASAVPLSNLAARLIRPASEGVVGAAMVAPQEYAQTGDVGIGTLSAGVAPGVGEVAGKAISAAASGAKNAGIGIMESVVKAPKGRQTVQGYTPELAFEQGVISASPTAYGGVEKTLENIEKRMSDLNEQYSDVLKEAGKGTDGVVTKVDMQTPMQKAALEVQQGISNGSYGDISEDLGKAVERWSNAVETVSKDGSFTAEQVVNFRKRLGSVAKFGKNVPERDQQADAIFAKMLYGYMNESVADVFPQVRKLDSEMSKLYPLRTVYEPAEARLRSNNLISPMDAAAIVAGGTAGAFGGGDPMSALPVAMASLLARRATVSPMVARGLYGAGRIGEDVAPAAGVPISALFRGSRAFYPTPSGEE